jgi:hypothetical protein
MGAYRWDSRSEAEWTQLLGEARSEKANRWVHVFEQHPEFFGIEESKALGKKMSLRWRRAFEQIYDPEQMKTLTIEERGKLQANNPDQELKLARPPLNAEQIQTLLTSAIELHARAVAAAERRRWLVSILLPAIISSVFALLGVLLGAWLT